jgi:hypothetical protein
VARKENNTAWDHNPEESLALYNPFTDGVAIGIGLQNLMKVI